MKLGCIFKTMALVVVFLGISFYLYDKYGKDFIEVSKNKAKEIVSEEIENILDEFNTDELSDIMKKKVQKLSEDFEKKKDELTDEQWTELKKKYDEVIKKNKIDDKTIEELKAIIKSPNK